MGVAGAVLEDISPRPAKTGQIGAVVDGALVGHRQADDQRSDHHALSEAFPERNGRWLFAAGVNGGRHGRVLAPGWLECRPGRQEINVDHHCPLPLCGRVPAGATYPERPRPCKGMANHPDFPPPGQGRFTL